MFRGTFINWFLGSGRFWECTSLTGLRTLFVGGDLDHLLRDQLSQTKV